MTIKALIEILKTLEPASHIAATFTNSSYFCGVTRREIITGTLKAEFPGGFTPLPPAAPPGRKKIEGWLNAYKDGSFSRLHATQESADEFDLSCRICCVKVFEAE